jgi:hypothetical protein
LGVGEERLVAAMPAGKVPVKLAVLYRVEGTAAAAADPTASGNVGENFPATKPE